MGVHSIHDNVPCWNLKKQQCLWSRNFHGLSIEMKDPKEEAQSSRKRDALSKEIVAWKYHKFGMKLPVGCRVNLEIEDASLAKDEYALLCKVPQDLDNDMLVKVIYIFGGESKTWNAYDRRAPRYSKVYIVLGLAVDVKQQVETQKATNAQIAQLTKALIAHGGSPAAGPATSISNTSLQMPALQLPQLRCPMFITCQPDMNVGAEHNLTMGDHLKKFHFKSLNLPRVAGVQESLRANAMDCIVWALGLASTPDQLPSPVPRDQSTARQDGQGRKGVNQSDAVRRQ
ncbi:hypothetical protein ACROYT_G014144 [Oculina patagonica]